MNIFFSFFLSEPEIGMPEHQAHYYFRQLISALVRYYLSILLLLFSSSSPLYLSRFFIYPTQYPTLALKSKHI